MTYNGMVMQVYDFYSAEVELYVTSCNKFKQDHGSNQPQTGKLNDKSVIVGFNLSQTNYPEFLHPDDDLEITKIDIDYLESTWVMLQSNRVGKAKVEFAGIMGVVVLPAVGPNESHKHHFYINSAEVIKKQEEGRKQQARLNNSIYALRCCIPLWKERDLIDTGQLVFCSVVRTKKKDIYASYTAIWVSLIPEKRVEEMCFPPLDVQWSEAIEAIKRVWAAFYDYRL